jgi:hypothetical protein
MNTYNKNMTKNAQNMGMARSAKNKSMTRSADNKSMVRNTPTLTKRTQQKTPKQKHDKKCHGHKKKELKRLGLPSLQLQQKHKAKNTTH